MVVVQMEPKLEGDDDNGEEEGLLNYIGRVDQDQPQRQPLVCKGSRWLAQTRNAHVPAD